MRGQERKLLAEKTLEILDAGKYNYKNTTVSIKESMKRSVLESQLISSQQSDELLGKAFTNNFDTVFSLWNESAVASVFKFEKQGIKQLGLLNFASAKNPGGGFISGAVAQEEDLAISSGLYSTQLKNENYYHTNRKEKSMIYTDTAIFSPDVPFFRDENYELVESPVYASVLTIPAVNLGQVIQKGENQGLAKLAMKNRMDKVLALFLEFQRESIILGAYGAGVFRNNPEDIAQWWKELFDTKYNGQFKHVHFAVLDRSQSEKTIKHFESRFAN